MRSTTTKIVLIITTILVGVLLILYRYATKPPPSIKEEVSCIQIDATQFYQKYTENPIQFDKNFINKAIGISGAISSIQDSIIVLNNKVVCMLSEMPSGLKIQQTINIKGRYIGYDDLFDTLNLNECILE